MLRSTFYSFTTALRGLNTAQKQLDVTGQNISNASTTGYTRQRADTYASTAAGYNDLYTSKGSSLVGQGSVVSGISQARDPFLDVRFRREASVVGEEDANLSCMKDMQLTFDEIESTTGLRANFSDFVTQLNSLASSANSSTSDDIVRNAASALVNQFKQYSSQLGTIRKEQESELKTVSVTAVNDLLKNIAGLNDSIRSQEIAGGSALELKDERNLLLDELSTYVNIDVSYKERTLSENTTINDISINMVGEDGNKTPLVYNNVAASFSAALPGEKDATGATVQEAVVTIDNSDVQAKSILETVNKALESISAINKKISTVLTTNSTSLANYAAALGTASASLDANKATLASGTITDPTALATLKQTIADLQTKVNDLTTIGKLVTLRDTTEATLTTALTDTEPFKTFGLQLSVADSVDSDGDADIDVDDYRITLKDSLGATIKETDGTTMTLIGGTAKKEMTKASLLQTGVTFENTIANEAKSSGSIKGVLDMLNSKGTFDYDNNEIRGIAYYQNRLDSLANQFASDLNKINNITGTLSAVNSSGTEIEENLFETSDGTSTITASNIKIASGWLTSQYGITKTKKVTTDGATGANENVNLMITQCSAKSDYKTSKIVKQDSYGNYLKSDGTIFATGKDSAGNYTNAGKKVANKDFFDYEADETTLKTTQSLAFRSESLLYNGTYQDFLSSTGTVLDLDISTTSNNLTNHATILEDIQDSKDSISSVSIDEEGINLMQYQKAYNAAARLMTTLDEAIDSIINMGTVGR